MTYKYAAFPSLRQCVSHRVSIAAILAGFLAISQAHADASITGKACVIDGDSLAVGGTLNNEQWCRGGVVVRISGIAFAGLNPYISTKIRCRPPGSQDATPSR